MSRPDVHVVGAGLAGLAAAERLLSAGVVPTVWEAAPRAGGRCRSFFDDAFGAEIDNGNHLLLSGNAAALDYARRIGGAAALTEHPAAFPFVDIGSGARWTLRPSGRLPGWILDPSRRVPGSRARDYLAPLALATAGRRTRVTERLSPATALYARLWRPVLLAALNTEPEQASARLAARLLAETFARGEAACRPVIATGGLGPAFVDGALALLAGAGAPVRLAAPVRSLASEGGRATGLAVAGDAVPLNAGDRIVLAVPSRTAAGLLPGLAVPEAHAPIVNVHFALSVPDAPPFLGIVGGLAEWLFAFPGRLSVTISAADRLSDTSRADIAAAVWAEVAAILALPPALPRWQVIRERRATFAATPAEVARRPVARTRLANVVLAGDYTDTGLPATIEGAVRSGCRAADLVLADLAAARSRAPRKARAVADALARPGRIG